MLFPFYISSRNRVWNCKLFKVKEQLLRLSLLLALGAPLAAAPPADLAHEAPQAQPAPVWRFDGEDFFLCERAARPGLKTLAFLRETDSPDRCNRRLWIRKAACKDLRSFEKQFTAGWDASKRDVTYRSSTRLVHSAWIQRGSLVEWRLMHWELHGGALFGCEYELLSRPPTHELNKMSELVKRQRENWTRQLAEISRQADGWLAP